MNIAYRATDIAFRADENGEGGVIEGRMVPYNEWTVVRSIMEGGPFLERILPGALKKTLAERAHRMRVLFHHGLDSLGKQPIAQIEEIADRADGLYYRARLFPSVPPLIVDGLRSEQYGASVGMRLPYKAKVTRFPKKSEHNPEGLEERSVTEAAMNEFSITAFPVYEGGTASMRAVTDDVARLMYGEAVVASFVESDRDGLLQLVRTQLEAEEPTHSEPDEEVAPEAEPEPAEEPAEEEPPKDEPEPVEASRDTQKPKPTKDWLSEQEVAPPWVIP